MAEPREMCKQSRSCFGYLNGVTVLTLASKGGVRQLESAFRIRMSPPAVPMASNPAPFWDGPERFDQPLCECHSDGN